MININKLINLLQEFNQDSIFFNNKGIGDAKNRYTNLTLKDIELKKYYGLCGKLSLEFQNLLRNEYEIESKYIGMYYKPLKQLPISKLILDDINNNTGYIDSLEFNNVYDTYRWTHVVLEINLGNEKRIIDPTNGIFYNVSKEDLLRGVGVSGSIKSNGQLEFLQNSIHINQTSYYYLTEKFWKSVYYLAYDNWEGIDITQKEEYNLYDQSTVWSIGNPKKNNNIITKTSFLYKDTPIEIINDIPIFCNKSEYIDNYNEIAKFHLEQMKDKNENPFQPKEYELFYYGDYMKIFNEYKKENDVILDVGVSVGGIYNHMTNSKNKFGFIKNCYGVDISLNYLNISKEKGINVCCAMIEKLPYYDNFFDIISCKDILEHVFDLYNSVKELYRILKDNGYLLVQVPYKQDMKIYATEYTKFKYSHIRNFDEWTMILLFEKMIGFKCIYYNIVIPNLNVENHNNNDFKIINMLLKK